MVRRRLLSERGDVFRISCSREAIEYSDLYPTAHRCKSNATYEAQCGVYFSKKYALVSKGIIYIKAFRPKINDSARCGKVESRVYKLCEHMFCGKRFVKDADAHVYKVELDASPLTAICFNCDIKAKYPRARAFFYFAMRADRVVSTVRCGIADCHSHRTAHLLGSGEPQPALSGYFGVVMMPKTPGLCTLIAAACPLPLILAPSGRCQFLALAPHT